MTVKIKICGIQTLEAAQAASEAGADFLGFNFVKISNRYITPGRAKKIIDELNNYLCHCEFQTKQSRFNRDRRTSFAMTNRPKVVGVFKNENIKKVYELIKLLNLDYVQLHGDESPEYISSIYGAGVIKSFSLDADFDIDETIKKIYKYRADYFLLDRKVQGRGKGLNLKKVVQLISLFSIFLAGGLTPENISRILSIAKPDAVDVAGGVEENNKKDILKIIQFIKLAKNYE